MRALFLQQDHLSPVGPVGARFAERGYELEELLVVPEDRYDEPDVTVDFPDPRGYDVIVPMGAPWSVYDEDKIGSWVGAEKSFLRAAHESEVPVFAICFGAQALASALGGTVERAPESEIGWHAIDSDDHELVEPGPWFQWHHDRFAAPPGARVWARTEVGPQVYTIGRSMGVQFHPELESAMLHGWLSSGGDADLRAHGMDRESLIARTTREEPAAAIRSKGLVDRFLDRVAGPGTPRT